jgi:hypothetical protein
VYVPGEEKVTLTGVPLPLNAPDQETWYGGVPPEAAAEKVTDWFTCAGFGDATQETERVLVGDTVVMVISFEVLPSLFRTDTPYVPTPRFARPLIEVELREKMSPEGTGHPEKQPAPEVLPVKTKVALPSKPEPEAVNENPPETGGEGFVCKELNTGFPAVGCCTMLNVRLFVFLPSPFCTRTAKTPAASVARPRISFALRLVISWFGTWQPVVHPAPVDCPVKMTRAPPSNPLPSSTKVNVPAAGGSGFVRIRLSVSWAVSRGTVVIVRVFETPPLPLRTCTA